MLANTGAVGATGPQIMKELGIEDAHRSTFYKALNKLVSDGKVIKEGRRYYLNPDQEDDE